MARVVDPRRGITYGIVQPGRHTPDGVPVVRANNIKDGRIVTDDLMRVGREIEAGYRRTRLVGGEVLLTLVGTLGECAVVPNELKGFNVVRAVGVIAPTEGIDAQYLKYALSLPVVHHCIDSWATTTVQATFNLRDAELLPVVLPPKRERQSILQILAALDSD